MDLAAVMDQVGDQLDGIAGLRVFRYPPDHLVPPAAIVSYPDTLTFDENYRRGADRLTLPVVLVVGRVSDRASRDRLAGYCRGSGSGSVKAVIEAGSYTACDSVRVVQIEFDAVAIAAVDYIAAMFDLDVIGRGVT